MTVTDGEQPHALVERRDHVLIVTMNRPAARNALSGPMLELMRQAWDTVDADPDIRACILTGAGGAFCAGADLKAIDTFGPRLGAREGPLGFTRLTAPKPTVAAISGWCLAGGFELALWCDLRIAADSATLGFPERRWGVPLIDGGTQRLPRIVGLGRALDLILSGRMVGSDEALAMGLLTEVVTSGRHLERALEYAEALAAFPQITMLADRRAAIEGLGLPLEAGLAVEARAGLETFGTAVEGAGRFAAGEGRGGQGAGV